MTSERPPGGVCLECERYWDTPTCPVHPSDPLLDPRQEAVIDTLRGIDDRRRDRLFSRWTIGAALGALLAGVCVSIPLVRWVDGDLAVWVCFGAMGMATAWARREARKRFEPRFGRWTGEDLHPELTPEEIAATDPEVGEPSDSVYFPK